MSDLLVAVGLEKRFGDIAALDGFELTVAAGEIVGLVGHNGAGKTTFARVVAGLTELDRGHVEVAGYNAARDRRQARRYLGLAPQELALYPTATARENLLVFAGVNGMRRRDARERIAELAASMSLTEILDLRVRDLSGGQQRRLQAATAMVHRPSILLLDEPTVGADPITRDALLTVVRTAANQGAAVVYTTHYLPELDVLDATIAVANHGRVIARGDRASLLGAVPGLSLLRFDHPPPPLDPSDPLARAVRIDGTDMTITAADPATAVAALLASMPNVARNLRTIEVQPPTLDDLYHHLFANDH